ncbi:MAG: hypothetical protein QW275_01790, partial [Candidatus Anstonellaceae archaeon]
RLERLLKKENKGQKDVEAVISLLEESGAIESARETAKKEVASAISRLKILPHSSRKNLEELAEYIVKRTR